MAHWLRQVYGKTHPPTLPPQLLQGASLGNLPLIGTLKRIHIRRKEEEKKETGHKQRYCADHYRHFYWALSVRLQGNCLLRGDPRAAKP